MSEQATGPDAGTIGRLAAQRQRYKQERLQAAKERDDARAQLAELNKQLEELKKGDPSGRVQELQAELRTLKHRRAFDRLAKERGAAEDVLDDLFDLLKYKAASDDPDETALAKLLDEAAAHPARSRFFASWDDEEGDDSGADAGRTPIGDDAGRGARHDGNGTVYVTRAQLADPRFALDPKNAELLKTAKVKG